MKKVIYAILITAMIFAEANAQESVGIISMIPPELKSLNVVQRDGEFYVKVKIGGKELCYFLTSEDIENIPRTWEPLIPYLMGRETDPTDIHNETCMYDSIFTVADTFRETRPVYDIDTDKKIGNIPVGIICENFVRKSMRGMEYRVVNFGELSGYSLCEVTYVPRSITGSIN